MSMSFCIVNQLSFHSDAGSATQKYYEFASRNTHMKSKFAL